MKKINLSLCLVMSLFALNAFGQLGKNVSSPTSSGESIYEPPKTIQNAESARQERNRQNGMDNRGMMIPAPPLVGASSKTEKEVRKNAEIRAEEARRNYEITLGRLKAPAIYYTKYESFLRDEKTGLARLFVDKNCDEGKTVSVEELERCGDFIPVKGGGSYYSFRLRANTSYSRDWWDLHFVDDKFKAGNNAVQTIIAEIGDVDLESVKLNSNAFEFLRKYKPKETLDEIKEQAEVLKKGIESNKFTYSNVASVNLNSTYVLRTIAYRLDGEKVYNYEDEYIKLIRPFGSGRAMDVMVTFKVVGREKDGSLILLWKELKMDTPRKILK